MEVKEFIHNKKVKIINNLYWAENTKVSMSDKNVLKFLKMSDIIKTKLNSDYMNIKSNTESFTNYSIDNDYVMLFITITSSSSCHKNFLNLKKDCVLSALDYSKNVLDNNRKFFNSLMKMHTRKIGRLFPKESYYYLKALETHKSGYFHEHVCLYIKKDLHTLFLDKIISRYIKLKTKYSLGRMEVLTNYSYKDCFYYNKKIKGYVPDFVEQNINSGEFIYFKKPKNQDQLIKYAAKYSIKNIRKKKELQDNLNCITSSDLELYSYLSQDNNFVYDQAIFSYTKKRRINFSRTFPRYLQKFTNSEGKRVFEDYSKKDLMFKPFYKNYKKEYIIRPDYFKDFNFDSYCNSSKFFSDKIDLVYSNVLELSYEYFYEKYDLNFYNILRDISFFSEFSTLENYLYDTYKIVFRLFDLYDSTLNLYSSLQSIVIDDVVYFKPAKKEFHVLRNSYSYS